MKIKEDCIYYVYIYLQQLIMVAIHYWHWQSFDVHCLSCFCFLCFPLLFSIITTCELSIFLPALGFWVSEDVVSLHNFTLGVESLFLSLNDFVVQQVQPFQHHLSLPGICGMTVCACGHYGHLFFPVAIQQRMIGCMLHVRWWERRLPARIWVTSFDEIVGDAPFLVQRSGQDLLDLKDL